MSEVQAQTRTERENFRRRRHSFFKYATDFNTCFNAEVYVLISRNGKLFRFKSTDAHFWPPADKDIVNIPYYLDTFFSINALRSTTYYQIIIKHLHITSIRVEVKRVQHSCA